MVYLYYRFGQRPAWFRTLWRVIDIGRGAISLMPFRVRKILSSGIALCIYWPLSRIARTVERAAVDVRNFPLSAYRAASFYALRTDALDRFGTQREHRFTRAEIAAMAEDAGLIDLGVQPARALLGNVRHEGVISGHGTGPFPDRPRKP